VFCSRVQETSTGLRGAISREQAWRILKEAFGANELTGKLGTDAMRKTFANRMYEKLNRDLVKVQCVMGHCAINSTVANLSFREEDIADAILAAYQGAYGRIPYGCADCGAAPGHTQGCARGVPPPTAETCRGLGEAVAHHSMRSIELPAPLGWVRGTIHD
jgi:hypothetical protein